MQQFLLQVFSGSFLGEHQCKESCLCLALLWILKSNMNVHLVILQNMIQALIKTNWIKWWFIYCCYQLFFEDQSNSIEYKVADFVFTHCVLFCHFTVREHCTKKRLHMLTFDLYKKCECSVLILYQMAASCVINCGVVAVSIVWKEFCWAATGTDTSTWSNSSFRLLVDNEAGLLAPAGAVFKKNILLSRLTFYLSLCFLKPLWETRAKNPILAMSIFLLLHKIHNAFVESRGTFFSHLLKHSSASQLSLKVVTQRFLSPGILLY